MQGRMNVATMTEAVGGGASSPGANSEGVFDASHTTWRHVQDPAR